MMHRSKIVLGLAAAFAAKAAAQVPAPQQPVPVQQAPAPGTPPPVVAMGGVNFQNASLTEVIDQLARLLHINYILDPAVKGSVTMNTYGDPRGLDARNLLEQILRISGFGMTQVGDVYRIVPLKDMARLPIRPQVNAQNIPEDDQTILNLVFLKYVTVDALTQVLAEFTGENARLYPYPPANLLLILDSRRNMLRTMELIQLFDSDSFASQRVHLFEVKNTKPSDIVKELENILKSISLDPKTSPVRFLPVDRVNLLIAVAPNPGVFDTVGEWLAKLDVPVKVTAGAVDTHVYRVRYGRSDCLAISLGMLFGSSTGGYGGFGNTMPAANSYGGGYAGGGGGGGGYAGGYGGNGGGYAGGGGTYNNGYSNPGGYGNANNFSNGFGGTGACGGTGVGAMGGGASSYGYPAFGGYAAQTSNGTGQIVATAGAGSPMAVAGGPQSSGTPGQDMPRPPRIVPNPLDNALIIQADAQQYQSILKILQELDIPPRQILLESKIYEIDLQDQWQYGVNYTLGPRTSTQLGGASLLQAGTTTLTVGALVSNGRELLATLTANENVSKVHMLSEPSLIATDSIPASITVGSQIPVSTGSTSIPTTGGVAVSSSLSSENIGITFQVNARVNPSGIVTLIINQEISGIDNTNTTNSSSPAFSQQVVQTQITVQDGDTIAIGGTIQDSVTNTVTGVPGLDRLPFIGGLFGVKGRTHTRSEMIIFMTPHVIYDETGLIEASDELKARLKDLRKIVKDL
jgi:general secretion pathway protein D